MPQRYVAIHYTLTDKNGQLLESSIGEEPLTFVEGTGQVLPKLEGAVLQMKPGDKKKVFIPSTEAYGEKIEDLSLELPIDQFPDPALLQIGLEYDVEIDDNTSHLFRVAEVKESLVILDGNHPLAGKDLYFDVELAQMRAATSEEIEAAEDGSCGCDHDHDADTTHVH